VELVVVVLGTSVAVVEVLDVVVVGGGGAVELVLEDVLVVVVELVADG